MNQLIKRLTAGLLSGMMLLSGAGCSWHGGTGSYTTDSSFQSSETSSSDNSDCFTWRNWVDTMPVTWNPQDWTNSAEEEILSLTTPGLYTVFPADNQAGYTLEPELAASAPVDVTAQYAGNTVYGVPGNAQSGYAYRIDLNPRASWDDGTIINAETYRYSLEQMLRSDAKHSRASRFWSTLPIANAWTYYMQDRIGYAEYQTLADAGYSSVAEAQNDGVTDLYLDLDGFWGLDCGWKSLNDDTLIRDAAVPSGKNEDLISASYLYRTYLASGCSYSAYQSQYIGICQSRVTELDFGSVGILKTGEYQITLILDSPLTAEAVQWALTSGWLVQPDRYVSASDYGTSPDCSPSCGPYRLTELTESSFRLERNDRWYGYSQERYQGQYQATAVEYTWYASDEEAGGAFDRNLLDTVTVSAAEGDFLSEPGTAVTGLTCNSSLTALNLRETAGIDKSILSQRNFRQALFLALDRQTLTQAIAPGCRTVLGLLSDPFLSDLSAGTSYRTSSFGQQVLTDSSGNTAANLFQQAYEEALNASRISQTDIVELELLVPNQDESYEDLVCLIQEQVRAASVGTALENRIHIVKTVDDDWDAAVREGRFDLILSTWDGDVWDPYRALEFFCDATQSVEFGFEPDMESCSLQVGTTWITHTYQGWLEMLVSGKYASADADTRNRILSGLEAALLEECRTLPLYQSTTLSLDSGRIARTLEEPLPLIGFGGVRFVQFTLNDDQWARETGVSIS